VTQTTLSIDDTANRRDSEGAFSPRSPEISGPHKEDVCYGHTNAAPVNKVAPGGVPA